MLLFLRCINTIELTVTHHSQNTIQCEGYADISGGVQVVDRTHGCHVEYTLIESSKEGPGGRFRAV